MKELTYDELMKPPRVFIATGNTYKHREDLKSLGWLWDPEKKYWIIKTEDSLESFCIKAIADKGIIVKEFTEEKRNEGTAQGERQ